MIAGRSDVIVSAAQQVRDRGWALWPLTAEEIAERGRALHCAAALFQTSHGTWDHEDSTGWTSRGEHLEQWQVRHDSAPPGLDPSSRDLLPVLHEQLARSAHIAYQVAEEIGRPLPSWTPDDFVAGSRLRAANYSALHGGFTAHIDLGVFTVIIGADRGGLRVRECDGSWVEPDLRAGMVLIPGALAARVTAGVVSAAQHEVVRGDTNRTALLVFAHPGAEAPVDEETGVTVGEFMRELSGHRH